LIEIAHRVEEERIAAPAEEKTEVADFRHQGFSPDGDPCSLDHNFAVVAEASGSCALNSANCRSLLPMFG
jgi:hypothetical protein